MVRSRAVKYCRRLRREIGLSEEMDLLTSLTISGQIPFESSFRLRCSILKQIPVSRVRAIVADIPLDPVLEAFIRDNRERCAVVTGNLDVWVKDMLDSLDCASFSSRGTVASDWLESVSSVLSKDQAVKTLTCSRLWPDCGDWRRLQ